MIRNTGKTDIRYRVNADGDLTHDRRSGIDPPPLLSVTAGLELTRRSGYYWASPN